MQQAASSKCKTGAAQGILRRRSLTQGASCSQSCWISWRSTGQRKKESEVAQSYPTLCNLTDYSPPGSSILGIFQARVLECVATSFSRGSSWPRDRNPGLPHCGQMLYSLSHQGSPRPEKIATKSQVHHQERTMKLLPPPSPDIIGSGQKWSRLPVALSGWISGQNFTTSEAHVSAHPAQRQNKASASLLPSKS